MSASTGTSPIENRLTSRVFCPLPAITGYFGPNHSVPLYVSLPFYVRNRFQPELMPGESILWAGVPNPKVIFHPDDWIAIPFSLNVLRGDEPAGAGDPPSCVDKKPQVTYLTGT
jgi:hypothetical protein